MWRTRRDRREIWEMGPMAFWTGGGEESEMALEHGCEKMLGTMAPGYGRSCEALLGVYGSNQSSPGHGAPITVL